MYTALFHTHRLVVSIFLALYFVKMVLLLMNRRGQLDKFRKWTKIPEMIISVTFLGTGIWMLAINQSVSFYQILKFVSIIIAIPLGVIGFGRGNKLLGTLSFVFLVLAYGLSEMGRRIIPIDPLPTEIVTEPNDVNYDLEIHGGAVYNQRCMYCHGRDGKLGARGATDLSISKMNRGEIIDIVRDGKGMMPGFGKTLNEQEIQAVAAYTESLKTN